MFSHDIIIIGGGAAGLSVASGAAQLGLKTALIDKGQLGGACLHFGCVPSKSLIKSADFYESMSHTEKLGLPKIKKPEVDMQLINDRVQNIIKDLEYHDSPQRFRDLGCDVYLTTVKFKDKYTLQLKNGDELSSKKIIIATGSSPRFINIPGLKDTGYITNRDIFSLKKLPKTLVTIGAGPIGIELSQALSKLGTKVTIITDSATILPKEDSDMSKIVQDDLLNSGVELIFNAKINSVTEFHHTKRVLYTGHAKNLCVEADTILLSVGREGNTSGLGLEDIGIDLKNSFIKVDKYLRTSQKHIMAIGDCNGKFLFTHVAGAEASNAIKKNIFGIKSKMNYQVVPWCTYTKPEISSIGYNEVRAKEAGIFYKVVEAEVDDIDRAHAEGKTEGKIKVLIDKKDRVIGTQIVSYSAGELILPSIMTIGKKLSTFLSPIYPYPTLGEIHREVAGNYYSSKLFNSRNRRLLKFLFRFRG
ncbi:MAG: FAD-dependent oxidoreductase [Spirochaetaceae bacterium]